MNSVYIKAMEIGVEHPNGIKYNELKKKIEQSTNIEFDAALESTFMKWIAESFDSTYNHNSIQKDLLNSATHLRNKSRLDPMCKKAYDNFSSHIWVLKGNTEKQYIDYLELKESRETSEKANQKSNWSIFVAILAIIVSPIIGFYTQAPTPKPPFDVRVIDNKSEYLELKKENEELKLRLNKAELLISVLESEE